jgi:hypothetical protein
MAQHVQDRRCGIDLTDAVQGRLTTLDIGVQGTFERAPVHRSTA